MRSKICSDKRLKIVVTPDDLKPYGLNFNSIDCHDQTTQDSLKQIINSAIEQTNFNINAKTLFLELIPSSDGGGVLYLTQSEQFRACMTGLNNTEATEYIFCFDSFDNLIDAIKASQNLLSVKCVADCLYEHKGSYYLRCELIGCANDLYLLFKQYDAYIPKSDFAPILLEHGKCLIKENAGKTILQYFS